MYKLTHLPAILRMSDNALISMSEDNFDYKDYLAWVAKGNTPLPADPLPNPRIAEIHAELQLIDNKSIRALRENDTARIAALEAQAETLRVELRSLTQ